MAALAYSQFCYQDALAQSGVKLSGQCNAESGIGCRPLWAGLSYSAALLECAKGVAIPCARRLAAEHDRLPQSGHILVQRVLNPYIVFQYSLFKE